MGWFKSFVSIVMSHDTAVACVGLRGDKTVMQLLLCMCQAFTVATLSSSIPAEHSIGVCDIIVLLLPCCGLAYLFLSYPQTNVSSHHDSMKGHGVTYQCRASGMESGPRLGSASLTHTYA